MPPYHDAGHRLSGTFSVVSSAQHEHAATGWQSGQLTTTPFVAAAHSPDLMVDTHIAAALLTGLLVARADVSVARALAVLHRTTPGGLPKGRPALSSPCSCGR